MYNTYRDRYQMSFCIPDSYSCFEQTVAESVEQGIF